MEAQPIRDRTLADSGPKAVGMADNPVGHKPAVRPPGDTETVAVDRRVFFYAQVYELHQVIVVIGAIFAAQFGESIALSFAAAGIAEKDEIALSRQVLQIIEKNSAESPFGGRRGCRESQGIFSGDHIQRDKAPTHRL